MPGFRECINCGFLDCTLQRKCLGAAVDEKTFHIAKQLAAEALQIAALHQKAHQSHHRNHNFLAPAPFAGYARRKRKNGSYGANYNYLHTGNWHAVMRFFKDH